MKPKNVKQAIERDFVVISIYSKYSKRIRVTMKRRYHVADEIDFVDFWIDRDYFKRKYPTAYESH